MEQLFRLVEKLFFIINIRQHIIFRNIGQLPECGKIAP